MSWKQEEHFRSHVKVLPLAPTSERTLEPIRGATGSGSSDSLAYLTLNDDDGDGEERRESNLARWQPKRTSATATELT